jgi:hypothetical protein
LYVVLVRRSKDDPSDDVDVSCASNFSKSKLSYAGYIDLKEAEQKIQIEFFHDVLCAWCC